MNAPTVIPDARRIHACLLSRRRRDEARDRGTWLTLNEVVQIAGADRREREAVRGELISLTARGEVEAFETSNSGVCWRAFVEPVAPQPSPPSDGTYVLQREIRDGGRELWFDAETFDRLDRAQAALRYACWEQQARIDADGGSGYTGRRLQRLRILKVCDHA